MFTSESSMKAREAAEEQKSIYTKEFMEEERWKDLAREARISLPFWFARPSDQAIKSLLRRLGVSYNTYIEAFGWESAAHFEQLNPKWGMRPLAGLILELWEEKQNMAYSAQLAADGRGALRGEGRPRKEVMPRGVAKARRKPIKTLNENDHVNN
jgi:hypothetical protein